MSQKKHVRELLEFASETSLENVPNKIVERTKLTILDFIGNVLGALETNHEVVNALLDFASEIGGNTESTALGLDERINCLDAAMVHGVLGNFLDFSDGHFMGGHINDRVVPTALAVAERAGANGSEFISAVLAGYETYIRMGYALFGSAEPASAKAPLFVDLGPMASAVSAGKLLGLTTEQMAGAMGLAASMQISAGQYTVSGGQEKDMCSGHEARRAVFSALMAQKGVLGSKDILEGSRGLHQVVGGELDLDSLVDGLGEKFKIEECYFKPYPACRYLHASIDAAIDIVTNNEVAARDIKEVTITTNSSSARRSTYDILSHVSAIFSHQYQVAVVLTEGQPDLPIAWREKVKGLVGELIRKTKVVSSPEFDELYRKRTLDCGTWPSCVKVSMKDGGNYESTALRPKGDPSNPLAPQELEGKFRKNASKILSDDETDRLVQEILRMERVDDVRSFCQGIVSQIILRRG